MSALGLIAFDVATSRWPWLVPLVRSYLVLLFIIGISLCAGAIIAAAADDLAPLRRRVLQWWRS